MDGDTLTTDGGGSGSDDVGPLARADTDLTVPGGRHTRRRRIVLAVAAVVVLAVGAVGLVHERRGPRYPTAHALLTAIMDRATSDHRSQLVTYQDFVAASSVLSNTPGDVPAVTNSGVDQIDYPDGPVWMIVLGTDTACVTAPTRPGTVPPFVACPPYHLPPRTGS